MQNITSSQLTLLSSGNSQIYRYGTAEQGLVLKVVSSSNRREQRHLKNEFQILQLLRHPHIISSLKYRQNVTFMRNQQDKQPAQPSTHNILVLEHATKGNLLQHLLRDRPDLPRKRALLRQVVKALNYLHQEGVAHRDLKLDNILVFQQNGEFILKIADFGFSSRFQHKGERITFTDYRGTPKAFMAPEIHQLRKKPDQQYDATKTDIFALAVILFTTVMGRFPFEYAMEKDKLYKLLSQKNFDLFWSQHKVGKYQLLPQYRIEQFKKLFEQMTAVNPKERPSIGQICQNGWFAK